MARISRPWWGCAHPSASRFESKFLNGRNEGALPSGSTRAVRRLAASEFGMAIAYARPSRIEVANESIRDVVMAGRTRILVEVCPLSCVAERTELPFAASHEVSCAKNREFRFVCFLPWRYQGMSWSKRAMLLTDVQSQRTNVASTVAHGGKITGAAATLIITCG